MEQSSALLDFLQTIDFVLWGSQVSRAEWLGAALGLPMVILNARVHPAGWVFAFASALMYLLVFSNAGLYGMASLQVMFCATSLWGLWLWMRNRWTWGRAVPASGTASVTGTASEQTASALGLRKLTNRQRLKVLGITVGVVMVLGWVLDYLAEGALPWLDAVITGGSLVGTVLLALKYEENWLAWLVVNVLSTVLLVLQPMWPSALLYAVFTALSWWGWNRWQRQRRGESARSSRFSRSRRSSKSRGSEKSQTSESAADASDPLPSPVLSAAASGSGQSRRSSESSRSSRSSRSSGSSGSSESSRSSGSSRSSRSSSSTRYKRRRPL